MKLLKAVVLIFLAVLSIPVFSQDEPPVNIGEEYDVMQIKTRFGDTIFGLRCKNGTTDCNYKWDVLCEIGSANNTSPLGGTSDVPGYSRDGDNRPIRLFVCK